MSWASLAGNAATAAVSFSVGYGLKYSIEKVKSGRPLAVNIDHDVARIYGNVPDWVTFPYFFACDREHLPTSPPRRALDWWAWAREHNGLPAKWSEFQVIFSSRVDRTLLVNNLRVEIVDAEPAPQGSIVLHPVGGADIVHRQIAIDLDLIAPTVQMIEEGSGATRPSFSLALKKDEVAKLSVTASVVQSDVLVKWRGLLDVVVGNRMRSLELSDDGAPFLLYSGGSTPEYDWNGHEWAQLSLD